MSKKGRHYKAPRKAAADQLKADEAVLRAALEAKST